MNARYTIRRNWGTYVLVNPSGVVIAQRMTWRTATDLCRLKNAERDRKHSHPEFVKLAETLLAGEFKPHFDGLVFSRAERSRMEFGCTATIDPDGTHCAKPARTTLMQAGESLWLGDACCDAHRQLSGV